MCPETLIRVINNLKCIIFPTFSMNPKLKSIQFSYDLDYLLFTHTQWNDHLVNEKHYLLNHHENTNQKDKISNIHKVVKETKFSHPAIRKVQVLCGFLEIKIRKKLYPALNEHSFHLKFQVPIGIQNSRGSINFSGWMSTSIPNSYNPPKRNRRIHKNL